MLISVVKMENEMLRTRNSTYLQGRDLPHGNGDVKKGHHSTSIHGIGDQQSCMAIAAMSVGVGEYLVESEVARPLRGEGYGLWGESLRCNPPSLGEQQHFMSLASWVRYQLEAAWWFGYTCQEDQVPRVVNGVPVGGC
jgi:hypothetical protein